MWMKLWQTLLFCGGVFLPVLFVPDRIAIEHKDVIWPLYAAAGVATSWLGSVGIAHLAAFVGGSRHRGGGAGTERIAGRREALPHD